MTKTLADLALEPGLTTHERAVRTWAALKENVTDPEKCVTMAFLELVLLAVKEDTLRDVLSKFPTPTE